MGRPLGQLDKSLAALTIGVAQARQAREKSLRDGHTGEWEQQVRATISGHAGSAWAWFDQRVNFDIPFLYAPLQRPMPWGTPQFAYGVEHTQTTKTLVVVNAHVLRYAINQMRWCTGVFMRYAVQAPAATDPIPFSADVHLTFQGFSSPAEQEEEL